MTLKLANPDYVRQLVRRHQLRIKKRLGQHFVVSPAVVERIAQLAEIGPQDAVIEIGPGLGALTELLARRARQVLAVEVDPDLVSVLKEQFAGCGQVSFLEADFLELDLAKLIQGGRNKIVGNLPYYITSPIVKKVLSSRAKFDSFTIMVQKEVAQRMTARPATREYGLLTLGVQYYAEVIPAGTVPRTAFWPAPEVESALVKLVPHARPPVEVANEEFFFQVARAAFGQRRKMLGNALKSLGGVKADNLAARIEEAGIDPRRRGET
ncbi:MAG: 16S rRNA (adenine(1518)-N(6)/adenine(1519)-N(6))-dimethyltransferase RsmA, partial [Syntrophomonadaceae bacterium]|nr:16S rRNA (adenine(1518)-N(6)/adenine(1519)-N(6))-dimethyltransferase RsmA [Syntrophomonadaceae bacterium]